MGAVAVKNAVHILPASRQALEDFEWLRGEVVGLGGQGLVFEVPSLKETDERPIVAAFQAAIADEFDSLRKEIAAMHPTARRGSERTEGDIRKLRALEDRFEDVSRRDFFDAPGRREVDAALRKVSAELNATPKRGASSTAVSSDPDAFRDRTWVTRPRPGVDRFSSAWLIRRFVDRGARFMFAESPERYSEAIPFDMYQPGGFRHEGDRCTFEVLCERFAIRDAAVRKIGEIVHDIDLKEDRYHSPHTATVRCLVEGLRAAVADDAKLLEEGILVFEALYQSFASHKGRRTKRVVYT